MKDSVFKNLLVNLRALFTTNIRRSINQISAKQESIEKTSDQLKISMAEKDHFLNILDYFDHHEDEARKFIKEIDYLHRHWSYCNFPYDPDTQFSDVVSGYDETSKMPYVIHKNKKLFFPSTFSVEKSVSVYLNYVQVEKLLGRGDDEGTPHQYQSPAIQVSEGDVVFDIGAAEGLFALDHVEKASHIFIVESDPRWITPLRKTFAPYGDKVTIIQKFISTVDTPNTLSLRKLLSEVDYSSAFVKMDIEGYELPAIASAEDVLKEKQGIKIAAAAYHRQHDAEELKMIFEHLGYTSEFSNGYMLFRLYDNPQPPFFRKGMIRAMK